jgi:hypothetical protein
VDFQLSPHPKSNKGQKHRRSKSQKRPNLSRYFHGALGGLTVLRLKFHGLSDFTVSTLNLPFPFANDFFHSRFAVAFLTAAIFSGPKLPSSQRVAHSNRGGK